VFQVDASFGHLDVEPAKILALVQSINAISVKVPGFQAAPATAYVVLYSSDGGLATALIYLHYTDLAKSVAYTHDPPSFALTDLPSITEEATEFLESMGFMLDDTAFGTLSQEARAHLMAHTPLFHSDLSQFAKSQQSGDQLPEMEVVEVVEEEQAPQSASVTKADSNKARAIGHVLMSL